MLGENLDLSSDSNIRRPQNGQGSRPFVGVRFACCDVYNRVYVNSSGTAYEGACPRCGHRVRLTIGPHGTDSRFFTAY
jgi:rRNA maturation endonuclease Nob1